MNILLVNDDGPDSHGFALLRDAVKKHWKQSTVVAIAPKTDQSGTGMGVKNHPDKMKLKKEGPGFFVVSGSTPVDIVNYAFTKTDLFLSGTRRFDLVIAGVNHAANVGWNVMSSGTVGAALTAAFHYGACGWAFSQAFAQTGDPLKPRGDKATRVAFSNTLRFLPTFFDLTKPIPGECWNVNFPYHGVPKGWIQVLAAPHDPFVGDRHIPLSMRPPTHDASCLDDGYMTRSPLVLSYNPPMSW